MLSQNEVKEQGELWAQSRGYFINLEDMTFITLAYIHAGKSKTFLVYLDSILNACGMNEIMNKLHEEKYTEAMLLYKKLYIITEEQNGTK